MTGEKRLFCNCISATFMTLQNIFGLNMTSGLNLGDTSYQQIFDCKVAITFLCNSLPFMQPIPWLENVGSAFDCILVVFLPSEQPFGLTTAMWVKFCQLLHVSQLLAAKLLKTFILLLKLYQGPLKCLKLLYR